MGEGEGGTGKKIQSRARLKVVKRERGNIREKRGTGGESQRGESS